MSDGNDALSGDAYEGGAGPMLVLLHGLGGTWHIWKPVLRMLEARHRVLAVTLPGHKGGPSLPPGTEVTVENIADALLADLHRRGITRAHVAGNSIGGWLSLELARRGFAISVTALSPAGAWRTPKDYQAIAKPFRIVFALMPILIFFTTLFLRFAGLRRALNKQAMEHGDRMPAGEFRNSMKAMGATRILPALLTSMGRIGAIKPLDVSGYPVHIAWCECDKVIPFATYGKPMLEAVRGSVGVTVTGVGHVPMYDDPEQVAAVILATTAQAERLAA